MKKFLCLALAAMLTGVSGCADEPKTDPPTIPIAPTQVAPILSKKDGAAVGLYSFMARMSCLTVQGKFELAELEGGAPAYESARQYAFESTSKHVGQYRVAAEALAPFPEALEKLKSIRALEVECAKPGHFQQRVDQAIAALRADLDLIAPVTGPVDAEAAEAAADAAAEAAAEAAR